MAKPTPPAFLFDFDGVLLDSMEAHLSAWKEAIIALGGLEPSDTFLNSIRGWSVKQIAPRIKKVFLPSLNEQEIYELKIKLVNQKKAVYFPGALESLEKAQSIAPVAIVTNAPRAFADTHLGSAFGGPPPFPVFAREDHPKPKPSPLAYANAAEKLGIERSMFSKVVFFEDSLHGLKAGIAAGMIGIGIAEKSEHKVLMSAGATQCFEQVSEYFQV